MIKKLFKLAGLAALLTSACAPLSLQAMEVNQQIVDQISKAGEPTKVLKIFNTIEKENQKLYHDVIKDKLGDWMDWALQRENLGGCNTNNMEEIFKNCGMTDDDSYELLAELRFLNNPKAVTEQTIKKLITDIRDINVVEKIYKAIPENSRFFYRTVIETRFLSWISWALQQENLGGSVTNKTLETLFRNCGMGDGPCRKLLAERRFLLDDMTPIEIDKTTETVQEIAKSEKTIVSLTLTDNAAKGIARWFNKIQNKPLDCTSPVAELIKIDVIVNKYKIDDKTIISLLEQLMLNAYKKEAKAFNNNKINAQKLFDSLPQKYKKLQSFKVILNPPFRFDLLTNNSYFKPVAISLTVAAVGVIGFLMFKKFCPQRYTKISSLFKLPRLWSRTPKVNPLQYNFNYAV